MSAISLKQIAGNDPKAIRCTHWGVEDTATVSGSKVEIQCAFAQSARFLKNRIATFVSLPLASINQMALETKLRQIGAMEGSTSPQGKSA